MQKSLHNSQFTALKARSASLTCSLVLLGAVSAGAVQSASAQTDQASIAQPVASAEVNPVGETGALAQTKGEFPRTPSFERPKGDAKEIKKQEEFKKILDGTSTSFLAKETHAPWVLEPSAHPWPLKYTQPAIPSNLFIRTPDLRDAKIMFPGAANEAAEAARFTSNKFIVDLIALGSQVRGRQLEELMGWLARIDEQKKMLNEADEWQAYQFSKEARDVLAEFKDKIKQQSDAQIREVARQIQEAVTKITPVMDAVDAYETRMTWYNTMVLLKDGFGMFQSKVLAADAEILQTIDQFEKDNPKLPQPKSPVPPTEQQRRAQSATANVALTPDAASRISVDREPAQAVATPETGSTALIATLMVGVISILSLAGLAWLSFKRKRAQKQPKAE